MNAVGDFIRRALGVEAKTEPASLAALQPSAAPVVALALSTAPVIKAKKTKKTRLSFPHGCRLPVSQAGLPRIIR